ncbi:hypothetical protein F5887DRAFT_1075284 [Amanita rubescens]|nr:hypothetical protein F5887DRAFT_1075284 [Amanita rubescens]
MRCLPHGTPVTYKSTCRMLDSVLPHQRECCKVGIGLMLIDGRFTPERAPCARSSTSQSQSRQDSHGSHRWDSPRASRLLDDILDEFVKRQDELRVELAKSRKELKASLTSGHLSPMSDASAIREQSRKMVLVKEQPKGSSISDMKPASRSSSVSFSKPGKVMAEKPPLSPLRSSVHSGLLQSALGEKTRPRVTSVAKPEPCLAPRGLESSNLSVVHELPPARKSMIMRHKVLKSILETDSAITRLSPSLSVCAKAREQSIKTVLDRELPKGSSKVDSKPPGRVVSAPAPSTRGNARTPEKSPVKKGEVNTEK